MSYMLRSNHHYQWSLFALLALTALVYVPGLAGPFLFDDFPNLVHPLSAWINGSTGWKEVVFGNRSGILGRSVSMTTFLANASYSGLDPRAFKTTNLAIHLLCGITIYFLMSRLMKRDPALNSKAKLIAVLLAGVWLLHPIQVSTVLYVVQRMAQLSALFTFLALLAYVFGRAALEKHQSWAGLAWLFLALPAATVAASLSKENGALVPAMCAVIELGYFRQTQQSSRPAEVKVFFALFLLLPGALALGWQAFYWKKLVGSYTGRLFSLDERLLTQPRVLIDYIGALLAPRGAALGIYTDDFPVSRGLLDPPSTLIAIVALVLITALAWMARKQAPALFTGIGVFLVGHAMESTVIPLELYFEHRNYLPSIGIFLAVAGALAWLLQRLPASGNISKLQSIFRAGSLGLIVLLGVSTLNRAASWSSFPTIAAQGVATHPNSLRAHLDWSTFLMRQARYEETQETFERMAQIDNPSARNVAAIDIVLLECIASGRALPDSVAMLRAIAGTSLQLYEMLAFETFRDMLKQHECAGMTKSDLAAIIVEVVEAAPQHRSSRAIWRTRFSAAELYLRDGDTTAAQEQAESAWMSGAADPAVGVLLTQIYLINGDRPGAQRTLEEVKEKVKSWDTRGQKMLYQLEQNLRELSPQQQLPP